jgi:hypothetical protein
MNRHSHTIIEQYIELYYMFNNVPDCVISFTLYVDIM